MNTFTLGLIVIVYLLSLAFLGYLGYKKTSSASDYLVGGRDMNPMVMALSYGATFISASAIVGFGGTAAAFGMGLQWLCMLNMLVGVIIAFIVFGLRTRRLGEKLGASTFPALLGRRFNSRTIQVIVGSIIFICMPLYAAVVMKGGAVFLEQIFKINYDVALLIFTLVIALYVITGGMKGVMYTDALQAVIMFLCMLFLIFWFYKILGMGFSEANRTLGEMEGLVPDQYRALGHRGWTSMPEFKSPQWYTLVTSLIMGVGIGCLAQPQLVVRFMTVKSDKELRRGVLIGCIFLIITVGCIYHASALSNIFFMRSEGAVATDLVKDIDKIVPYFIDKAMPTWFSAIFMLCILSASMSTLSSQFHVMGSSVGIDVVGSRRKNENSDMTKIIRLGVLVSIVISYVICYTLPVGIIASGTAMFMGLCASAFLPTYVATLYWPRATRIGVISSMLVGVFATLFVMLFIHAKEAKALGICQMLFDRPVLIDTQIALVDPLLFALPLSTLTLIFVSLATKKE